jgi:AmiR/NasT family two-component response regulator
MKEGHAIRAAGTVRSDRAGRRVLIADDDPLIRMDLAEMLAEEGLDVVGQVGDGERAAALAITLRPDLVIMDVKMPGKDGIQAAETAAAQIAPVIILTAFSERDLIQRALDAGAMAYLAKPFSKATLLPAIELAAARYAETAALRAEVSEATQRLQARKVIDRAKGLLMTRQKMTEPQAFRWLKRTAIDRRTSMDTIARDVIERPAGQRQLITVPPVGSSLPGSCYRKDEVP